MKIEDVLKKGKTVVQDARIDNLALEVLLSHVLGQSKEYIFAHKEDQITDELSESFMDLVRRHNNGEPVAYLTNSKEFFGLDLFVDNRVLIPRPETEHIVETVLKLVDENEGLKSRELKMLDVGTGSGNIPIVLSKNLPNLHVTATDMSGEALEVARMNTKKFNLEEKVTLIESDLMEKLIEEKFDIITANLPYIGTEKNNFVARETKDYEPNVALYGGNDGLHLYEKLFEQISENNNCKHYLLGEIGFMQREALESLFKKYFPNNKCEIMQDLAGLDRYFIVTF